MNTDLMKKNTFRLLQDEAMRQAACQAVDHFLKNNRPVKKAQLHSIPLILQAKGLSGLRTLIENQKNKNTKPENRAFWVFLSNLILLDPAPEFSLRYFLQNQTEIRALFREPTAESELKEQKRIKKSNKAILNEILEQVLPIYFEHFNCHYFYRTRQGA